ncbi:MAG: hypothetical protein LQ342_004944 [Letrouitia transgressa]|nr:MAG: hypothetical protein LQ342_004944 [Letrouitia transgressa]
MAFYDLPRETSLQGQNDNGDCKSTLSQDCVDAVVQSANSTAASFTTAAGSSDDVSDLCGDMLRQFSMKIPNECQQMSENGAWLGGSAGLFGSSDSGSSPDENSTECNSVETKQNTVHQLFGFDYGDSSTFNETAYDDSVYRVVPFLTSAWLKRTTSGGPAWSDTRLVCMRAKNIQAGSRAPPPPPTTGLATRGRFLSLKNLVSFGCVAILLGLTL